ncbi:MAG TPA: energy transducer TonB [Terriglobia bacterium]|jgi:hypothetical protein|nr:energy transducer TonB [Terriglobia bacterium]
MQKQRIVLSIGLLGILFSSWPATVRAGFPEADQKALKAQYIGQVLIYRSSFRDTDSLEVAEDGSILGKHQPGYWAVDGALQVKDLNFGKDHVVFKCARLWANIKDDGQLHYFPASAALKGKKGYAEIAQIRFATKEEGETIASFNQRLLKVFLGPQDLDKLAPAPRQIASYIQKIPPKIDIDPLAGAKEFDGTLPKPSSTPEPEITREALLAGQAGRESFVVLVHEGGDAEVTGFTHILQFGLEEAVINAVKNWKFEPAMKDGKPVPLRIPMSIEFKQPNTR